MHARKHVGGGKADARQRRERSSYSGPVLADTESEKTTQQAGPGSAPVDINPQRHRDDFSCKTSQLLDALSEPGQVSYHSDQPSSKRSTAHRAVSASESCGKVLQPLEEAAPEAADSAAALAAQLIQQPALLQGVLGHLEKFAAYGSGPNADLDSSVVTTTTAMSARTHGPIRDAAAPSVARGSTPPTCSSPGSMPVPVEDRRAEASVATDLEQQTNDLSLHSGHGLSQQQHLGLAADATWQQAVTSPTASSPCSQQADAASATTAASEATGAGAETIADSSAAYEPTPLGRVETDGTVCPLPVQPAEAMSCQLLDHSCAGRWAC